MEVDVDGFYKNSTKNRENLQKPVTALAISEQLDDDVVVEIGEAIDELFSDVTFLVDTIIKYNVKIGNIKSEKSHA